MSWADDGDSAFGALAERVRARRGRDGRVLVGIAGPPAAGKSTLAGWLVAALGERAVAVSMDGFHLAQAELERLGRQDRKGAIDTFDVAGFVALLRRLRQVGAAAPDVYAPSFSRRLEEPVAGSVRVGREHDVVVVEGNYLLVDSGAWSEVRLLLDEAWYLDAPAELRRRRLVERYLGQGRSLESAEAQADGSDAENAELVASTRRRADLVLGPA